MIDFAGHPELAGHVHFHFCVVDGVFEMFAGIRWTSLKRALAACSFLRCIPD